MKNTIATDILKIVLDELEDRLKWANDRSEEDPILKQTRIEEIENAIFLISNCISDNSPVEVQPFQGQ